MIRLEETVDELTVLNLLTETFVIFCGSLCHDLMSVVSEVLVTYINFFACRSGGRRLSKLLLIVIDLVEKSLSHGGVEIVGALEVTDGFRGEALISKLENW